jgi:hypothetical protein
MKTIFTLLILIGLGNLVQGQVNGYAKVTGILGPILTVSDVNETYDQFTIGSKVIVMQMQDDVIGSNTSNNSSFGSLSSIAKAGKFEVATVLLRLDVLGILNTITLSSTLNNSFNIGSNSSVQIISFPTLGTGVFTTTSNISALPWNGSIGGVVAFNVNGVLTLNHNITADNAGFRGGAADATANAGSCDNTNYFSAVNENFGYKGEGIYKVTNSNFTAGMGRLINAGGGGNSHNAGGGGGGNFSAGGTGSMGYGCSIDNGGQSGISLNSYLSSDRVFMGGGAGGGEANNGYNTKGGNGGGIIIIKAAQIRTTGSGSPVRISSNGESAASIGNDGAGGGGAGGSQYLDVNSWNIDAAKPLIISSNGGNGGSVGDGARHGGGAGGGQGLLMFTGNAPGANSTVSTNVGNGGYDYSGGTLAQNGNGTNNTGIMVNMMSALPVKLVSFTAAKNKETVSLEWRTQNEQRISHYEIQRSANGADFTTIAKQNSKGDQLTGIYSFTDLQPLKTTSYYRLLIVDNDAKQSYSKIVVITAGAISGIRISPSPASSSASLQLNSSQAGFASIRILNMNGSIVAKQQSSIMAGNNSIAIESVASLSNGVYNVEVFVNNSVLLTRLIIMK